MKWTLALSLALAATPALAQDIPDYVTAAVADPSRGADAQDDQRRQIAEVMAYSMVKPGDTVLELVPGSGYWTRVFSRIVGPNGKVYLAVPTPMEKYSEETKALPGELPNTELLLQAADALSAPTPVDVAFTAQNYHDYPDEFMGPTDPSVLNRAVFNALKPGGRWIVIDHVAAAGSGQRDTETLHRIDPAIVRMQAEAAGFEYMGESDVLRNDADDHTLKVFDPAVRGHTDQFIYKFRKPLNAPAPVTGPAAPSDVE
jgi:predicted methyltransferase